MAVADQHHDPVSVAYATSLLQLAESRDQMQPIADEVGALQQVLEENPTFARFLADPGVDRDERSGVVERTFSSASPLMQNFLKLLDRKNRLGKLPQVLSAFETLMDEKLGKVEVNITVAEKLDDAQLEQVRQRVSRKLNKDAVVHQFVDPDILGGMVIRVQDQVIDASVRSKLDAMQRRLRQA